MERRVQAIGANADPASVTDPEEKTRLIILRELRNADVLTLGETRLIDGQVAAPSFQIKVANPKGLADDAAITDIVVDALVDEFEDQIDISVARRFVGVEDPSAANYVFSVEDPDLGRMINEPGLAVRAPEFLGGVAIVLRDITPPARLEEIADRIDQMRNQPDFQSTAGRRTEVVGLTPVNPTDLEGEYRDAVVMVSEPNLSALKVDSDVWYGQLAEPEWRLVSGALQRQSSLQQVSSFSSAVAETLSAQAIVAVVLSLLGILVYIWVRFGSFWYSAAAIVALMHDVIISLGLLAISALISRTVLGHWLGVEDFRIDLGVVAALLTIIGYSLNDTIVILDRIRENRGKRPLASAEIVNRSINQTISRTLLTSGTTLIAVAIMYSEGGSGIRPFTFCLLVGIVVGTYSSIAIAAPLVWRGGRGDQPMVTPEVATTTA